MGSKVSEIVRNQRNYFKAGKTRDISYRIQQLSVLKKVIRDNEDAILKAVKSDLQKPEAEAVVGEVGLVISEIDFALKNINSWVRPKRVRTPIVHQPAKSYISAEPLGVVLIICPWNYPFQLVIAPLVGALSAGNCSLLKPSEFSPNTSNVIAKIIEENFDRDFICVIEGGVEVAQELLAEKFDHIFFTGGTGVGKIVMEQAAKNLTPVTLELGGKCPCIVDHDTDVERSARRIVWGKFMNAGQTCVAPDYLLVDKRIKEKLILSLKKYIREFYGEDPSKSPDYGRIINGNHYHRLSGLLEDGEVLIGGDLDEEDRYIAPTLIDSISLDHKIMEEEIFGPILPVIEYDDLADAISIVNERPKPLALYFFSRDKEKQERVVRETSSGGLCVNDTLVHFATSTLPFGGVGNSGMGKYHGKAGFDTFSNQKSIMKRSFQFDISLRYPPFEGKIKMLRRMF